MAEKLTMEITKNNQSQKQLQEFFHTVEQCSIMIVITDVKGNVEYVNPAFTRITGYNKEEVIGRSLRMLQSGKTLQKEYTQLWESITAGGRWQGEFLNKKKNGELYWESLCISPVRDDNSNIYRFIEISEDITRQKETEEKLEKFGILFSETTDLAYICDREGNILFVNSVFEKYTGFKPEEFIGKPFAPLFDKENLKKATDVFTRTLKGEKLRYELRFKDTNILCEYKNFPLRDKKGDITGVIGVASDITERKHMEKELKLLNELLEHRVIERTQELEKTSEVLQVQIAEYEKLEEEKKKKINDLVHLIDFSNIMNSETSEDAIIKDMCLILKEYFMLDIVAVLVLDRDKNIFNIPVTYPQISLHELVSNDVLLDPNLCRIMRTGQEFVVKNINRDVCCECLLYKFDAGGHTCLPLVAGGSTMGAVLTIKKETGSWDREETLKLLTTYAGQAANAIHRIRLTEITRLLAITDALTGVYNRRFFDDMLEKMMALSKRNHEPLGILFIDVDYFKNVNDTYGHTVGDRVLQHVAKSILDLLRKSDVLTRYGGEEFAIILPSTDFNATREKAERIRRHVESIDFGVVTTEKTPIKITISIGVASLPEHGSEYETIVNAVDNALYKAKRNGRNRVEMPF